MTYIVTTVNFSSIILEEKRELQTPVSATEPQIVKQTTKKYQMANFSHVAPTCPQDRSMSVTL